MAGSSLDPRRTGTSRQERSIKPHDLAAVQLIANSWGGLGSRTWMTTSRVDLPTVCQVLAGELKPDSAIGTSDQDTWHRMLHAFRLFGAMPFAAAR